MHTQYNRSLNLKQAGQPIYSKNRIVGVVRGGTFYKTISGSRHLLRKPLSIAFDVSTLEQAEQARATRLEVHDRESGTTYRTTIQHLNSAGFRINRGYGLQLALPLSGWERVSINGRLPEQQLSLFAQEMAK